MKLQRHYRHKPATPVIRYPAGVWHRLLAHPGCRYQTFRQGVCGEMLVLEGYRYGRNLYREEAYCHSWAGYDDVTSCSNALAELLADYQELLAAIAAKRVSNVTTLHTMGSTMTQQHRDDIAPSEEISITHPEPVIRICNTSTIHLHGNNMIKSESPQIYRMPLSGEYLYELLHVVDPAFRPNERLSMTAAQIDALPQEAQEKLRILAGEHMQNVMTDISKVKEELVICREERLRLQGLTRSLWQRIELLKKSNEETGAQAIKRQQAQGELRTVLDQVLILKPRTDAQHRTEQQLEERLLDRQLQFEQLSWLVFVLKTHRRRMQPNYQATEEETMLSLPIPITKQPELSGYRDAVQHNMTPDVEYSTTIAR